MAKNQEIFRTKTGRLIPLDTGSNTITSGTDGSVLTSLKINYPYYFEIDTTAKTILIDMVSSPSDYQMSINGKNIELGTILNGLIENRYKDLVANGYTLTSGFNGASINANYVFSLKELVGDDWVKFESGTDIVVNVGSNLTGGFAKVEDY